MWTLQTIWCPTLTQNILFVSLTSIFLSSRIWELSCNSVDDPTPFPGILLSGVTTLQKHCDVFTNFMYFFLLISIHLALCSITWYRPIITLQIFPAEGQWHHLIAEEWVSLFDCLFWKRLKHLGQSPVSHCFHTQKVNFTIKTFTSKSNWCKNNLWGM